MYHCSKFHLQCCSRCCTRHCSICHDTWSNDDVIRAVTCHWFCRNQTVFHNSEFCVYDLHIKKNNHYGAKKVGMYVQPYMPLQQMPSCVQFVLWHVSNTRYCSKCITCAICDQPKNCGRHENQRWQRVRYHAGIPNVAPTLLGNLH